jgi:hypothetical protein
MAIPGLQTLMGHPLTFATLAGTFAALLAGLKYGFGLLADFFKAIDGFRSFKKGSDKQNLNPDEPVKLEEVRPSAKRYWGARTQDSHHFVRDLLVGGAVGLAGLEAGNALAHHASHAHVVADIPDFGPVTDFTTLAEAHAPAGELIAHHGSGFLDFISNIFDALG